MRSILEQRRIVESACRPFNCRCVVETDGSLAIQVRALEDVRLLIDVAGIDRSQHSSSRSISQRVLRLRQQLETQEQVPERHSREHDSLM